MALLSQRWPCATSIPFDGRYASLVAWWLPVEVSCCGCFVIQSACVLCASLHEAIISLAYCHCCHQVWTGEIASTWLVPSCVELTAVLRWFVVVKLCMSAAYKAWLMASCLYGCAHHRPSAGTCAWSSSFDQAHTLNLGFEPRDCHLCGHNPTQACRVCGYCRVCF